LSRDCGAEDEEDLAADACVVATEIDKRIAAIPRTPLKLYTWH
jgi:hypothetical protein